MQWLPLTSRNSENQRYCSQDRFQPYIIFIHKKAKEQFEMLENEQGTVHPEPTFLNNWPEPVPGTRHLLPTHTLLPCTMSPPVSGTSQGAEPKFCPGRKAELLLRSAMGRMFNRASAVKLKTWMQCLNTFPRQKASWPLSFSPCNNAHCFHPFSCGSPMHCFALAGQQSKPASGGRTPVRLSPLTEGNNTRQKVPSVVQGVSDTKAAQWAVSLNTSRRKGPFCRPFFWKLISFICCTWAAHSAGWKSL